MLRSSPGVCRFVALSFLLAGLALVVQAPVFSAAYFVDCARGNDANSGLSAPAAWRTLRRVNINVFRPGDSILLARGTTCRGLLHPQGSGSAAAVVTLDGYGSGRLPVIDAGSNEAAIELKDQSYWQIRNLETRGGDPYGIWITGNRPNAVIRHVYISNVVVHDVAGTPARTSTGLIVFNENAKGETFDDILVAGATAYNTTEWTGIYISGSPFTSPTGIKGRNITVRNCTVHDVGGDGIVIHNTRNALIENSVAYDTGLIKTSKLPTPDAIWNWNCDHCTVQYNEAFLTHTPGNRHDGAAYDSDYYNRDVTIQYNYAHDADGYCVSVFGAGGKDTNVDTVIRYNVCSNDGRVASLAHQGDFFISTWNGGSILNARIYNNTSYWNPASSTAYAVEVQADFDPSEPSYFLNNVIYSTAPGMEYYNPVGGGVLRMDHNIFWYSGRGSSRWQKKSATYSSLAAWREGAGVDAHSLYADPQLEDATYHAAGRPARAFRLLANSPAIRAGQNLGDMGRHDFFGNPLPGSGAVDIGADERP